MTTRARLRATIPILAMVALACGKQEEQAPVTTQPAPSTRGVAAAMAPAVASPAVATATTLPPPAGTAAPAVSATARPAATAAPVTTQAAQPPAPLPPAAATSVPPPATQEKPAEKPAATPVRPAAQRPKGKITLPAKLGAVTFDHEAHAGKRGIACTTCHHPSRPQEPLAAENQACRDCHTAPAAPPMKTSLQAAFHDPRAASGTCIACHKEKGGSAPVKCLECHKKK